MPTLPPSPEILPVTDQEKFDQEYALAFIRILVLQFQDRAYCTRSYMPGRLDSTDFDKGLQKLVTFCECRPDWATKILLGLREEFATIREPRDRGKLDAILRTHDLP
jgi:hypothetical protein